MLTRYAILKLADDVDRRRDAISPVMVTTKTAQADFRLKGHLKFGGILYF